jgi:hypothetical protein
MKNLVAIHENLSLFVVCSQDKYTSILRRLWGRSQPAYEFFVTFYSVQFSTFFVLVFFFVGERYDDICYRFAPVIMTQEQCI